MIKMLYLLSVITFSLCQDIPFIESIEPAFGGLGSTIIITGSDFSPNDVDNTVFFGGLEANILNATENELMVTVPYGAYYTPISVYTNGLYASSSQRFNVIFDAAEELTVSHISNQLDNPYLGAKYYDIKIADMNGDEIPEIVTSEAGSGSSAYLAIFTTSFDEEGMISIDDRLEINFGTGVYSVPHDIALGDLNGDGLLDIVTSEKGDVTDDFEAHTCIFINTSHHQNFSFDDPIIIPGDGYEMYAQVQDINGDGKLDIVTSRQSWGQMGVYLNTTEQNVVSFANKVIPEVDVEPRPVFADLNGDGIINMVSVANTNNRRDVYIYSNNSTENTINFNLELIVQSGGVHPPGPTDYDWCNTAPTLADIDGDGKLDIIIANGAASFTSPSGISVLRNISTPDVLAFEYDFLNYYQYTSNSLPSRISISDLNGDGKPDILTTDWLGGISIMVNSSTEGSIVLEEQMIIGIGNYPLSIATADLNMDSTPEIVVSNWDVEGLRVIHNFIPVNDSGIQGDLNGDENVDILDVIMLVNYILSGDTSELDGGDINNDGEVNILDVIHLVNIILGVTGSTVSDIDENIYEIIQIGDQLWMAENLKVTHFNNGDAIPTGLDNGTWSSTTEGAYAIYDDDPANAEIYGNLYNYYAVDDSRGICPPNYHIPTDDEWYVLLEYLGGDSGENWIIAGGKMKDVGTIEDGDGMWYVPNEGANNESDFTAIPAGFRLNDGQYYESGYYGIFWSSTAEYYTNAFFMWYLLHDESRLYRGLFDSQTGLSVRCLAD